MNRYLIGAITLSGLVMAGVIKYQHTELIDVREQASQAELKNQQYSKSVLALQTQTRKQLIRLAELAATNGKIREQSLARQQQIRKLQRENQQYQDWAMRPLPAVTQQLRKRPTLTGASDYQKYLSATQPLHPASQQPVD